MKNEWFKDLSRQDVKMLKLGKITRVIKDRPRRRQNKKELKIFIGYQSLDMKERHETWIK